MKKTMAAIAILVSALCAAAVARDYPVTLIEVMDGDTIRADIDLGFGVMLARQSIRVGGINAPETHTKNLLEKAAGLAVTAYVTELIGTDELTLVTEKKERGKFGRPLGVLMIGDLNLSDHLLDLGYAHGYEGGTKVPFSDTELKKILFFNLGLVPFDSDTFPEDWLAEIIEQLKEELGK